MNLGELRVITGRLQKHLRRLDDNSDGTASESQEEEEEEGKEKEPHEKAKDEAARAQRRKSGSSRVQAQKYRRPSAAQHNTMSRRSSTKQSLAADLESDEESVTDEEFLNFQASDLQGWDDDFNLRRSQLHVNQLLDEIKVDQRVKATTAIRDWFDKAAGDSEQMTVALDKSEQACTAKGQELDAAADQVRAQLELRGSQVMRHMQKFHCHIESLRDLAGVEDHLEDSDDDDEALPAKFNSKKAQDDGSRRGSKWANAVKRGSKALHTMRMSETTEAQAQQQEANSQRRKELMEDMMEEQNMTSPAAAGTKPKKKVKSAAGGKAKGQRLLASDILEVIAQQQEEIAHLRTKSEVGSKRLESMKCVLEFLSAHQALEEEPAAPNARASMVGMAAGSGLPALTDAAAELLAELRENEQMRQMEELLYTTEGREFLAKCAAESGNNVLEAQTKHAETSEEASKLEQNIKQLEEELASIPQAAERIRILQEELQVAARRADKRDRSTVGYGKHDMEDIDGFGIEDDKTDAEQEWRHLVRQVEDEQDRSSGNIIKFTCRNMNWLREASADAMQLVEAMQTEASTFFATFQEQHEAFLNAVKQAKHRAVQLSQGREDNMDMLADETATPAEQQLRGECTTLQKLLRALQENSDTMAKEENQLEEALQRYRQEAETKRATVSRHMSQRRTEVEEESFDDKMTKRRSMANKGKNVGKEKSERKEAAGKEVAGKEAAGKEGTVKEGVGKQAAGKDVLGKENHLRLLGVGASEQNGGADEESAAESAEVMDVRKEVEEEQMKVEELEKKLKELQEQFEESKHGIQLGSERPEPLIIMEEQEGFQLQPNSPASPQQPLSPAGSGDVPIERISTPAASVRLLSQPGDTPAGASNAGQLKIPGSATETLAGGSSAPAPRYFVPAAALQLVSEDTGGAAADGGGGPDASSATSPRRTTVSFSPAAKGSQGASAAGAAAIPSALVPATPGSAQASATLKPSSPAAPRGVAPQGAAIPGNEPGAPEASESACVPEKPPELVMPPAPVGTVVPKGQLPKEGRVAGVVVGHAAPTAPAESAHDGDAKLEESPSSRPVSSQENARPGSQGSGRPKEARGESTARQSTSHFADMAASAAVAKMEKQVQELLTLEAECTRVGKQIGTIDERIHIAKTRGSKAQEGGRNSTAYALTSSQHADVPDENKQVRREVNKMQKELNNMRKDWQERTAKQAHMQATTNQTEAATMMLLMNPPELPTNWEDYQDNVAVNNFGEDQVLETTVQKERHVHVVDLKDALGDKGVQKEQSLSEKRRDSAGLFMSPIQQLERHLKKNQARPVEAMEGFTVSAAVPVAVADGEVAQRRQSFTFDSNKVGATASGKESDTGDDPAARQPSLRGAGMAALASQRRASHMPTRRSSLMPVQTPVLPGSMVRRSSTGNAQQSVSRVDSSRPDSAHASGHRPVRKLETLHSNVETVETAKEVNLNELKNVAAGDLRAKVRQAQDRAMSKVHHAENGDDVKTAKAATLSQLKSIAAGEPRAKAPQPED